jgi:adenylosuccinate synthase
MPVDILLGLLWGDKVKGKIIDYMTPTYKMLAHFQGKQNAGHILVIHYIKI